MARYGKFAHYLGDNKVVPIVDAWTYTIDTQSGGYIQGPSAITAYTNFELAERADSIDDEAFIDIVHPSFRLTVTPREAKAIAKMLSDMADFIVEGIDEL